MKVLFVCSGNKKYEDSPIVTNQGDSLIQAGVSLEYFFIRGRGVRGYVRNLIALKRHLYKNNYDLIHAHYSLSGIISALAGSHPLVVSLMGSDVYSQGYYRRLIKMFTKWRWTALIVKSEKMKNVLGIDSAYVIPNGVDVRRFRPMPQCEARKRAGFDGRKHIVFVGNPTRREKNIQLAQKAVNQLNDDSITLDVVTGKPHELLPDILNAADALLLTSIYEGSPNVIKEAMACNCPIIATDVGNIKWVIGDTSGCFVTSFDPNDVACKIKLALKLGHRTDGIKRIVGLNLDAKSVAQRIIEIYLKILSKNS